MAAAAAFKRGELRTAVAVSNHGVMANRDDLINSDGSSPKLSIKPSISRPTYRECSAIYAPIGDSARQRVDSRRACAPPAPSNQPSREAEILA